MKDQNKIPEWLLGGLEFVEGVAGETLLSLITNVWAWDRYIGTGRRFRYLSHGQVDITPNISSPVEEKLSRRTCCSDLKMRVFHHLYLCSGKLLVIINGKSLFLENVRLLFLEREFDLRERIYCNLVAYWCQPAWTVCIPWIWKWMPPERESSHWLLNCQNSCLTIQTLSTSIWPLDCFSLK